LIAVLSLSACESTSVRVVDACSWVSKITPTEQDYEAASDSLLAQVLLHNELVAVNCEADRD
jgi:hypothetical protein